MPFKSEVGRFAISFPIEPTRKEMPVPGGIMRYRYLVALHDDKLVYSVHYADGKPVGEPRQALKQAQDGMVKAQGGKLLKEEEIHLGDSPGRAFSFSFTTNGVAAIQHIRTYLVGDRIYILIVAAPPALLDADDMERFFRSFSVLDKK